MIFSFLRRPSPNTEDKRSLPPQDIAVRLYKCIHTQARQPDFYSRLCVPDSLDGRFEMLALHMVLVLERLKAEGKGRSPLAQALFDVMFVDMDEAVRRIGVGDMGIGKHIKRMVKALYGRAEAYREALAAPDPEALPETLRRNVYGTQDPEAVDSAAVAALAAYLRRESEALSRRPLAELEGGTLSFGPVCPKED